METEAIEVSGVVPATCAEVYTAWLEAEGHGRITGAAATAEPGVGGRFTAWDGYIQGQNLALEPSQRIVQSWRTAEFPPEAADSLLEVRLEAVQGGTKVTLVHTEIPRGQGTRYQSGWEKHYLAPMRNYFTARTSAG